jgi:large subunit ribosomal protein L7/L12
MYERIAARAYERFLERGGEHGHDLEDWLAAEAELRSYDVILVDPGAREIELVREIRDITGMSLVAIKTVIDGSPRSLKRVDSLHEAQQIRQRLETLGARIELR